MMFKFLKLYRLDVFFIVILLFFFGAFSAGNFNIIGFNYSNNFIIGFLIAGVSVNFMYSLNSWFDSETDKINKPTRPIPCGLITKKQALIYSIVLGIISFIYPFFLFSSNIKFLFLIFILIGILYSNNFFSFKKNKYLSLISIIFIIVLVFLLGYVINNGNIFDNKFFINIILLFLLCVSILPLKDLTDTSGDKFFGLDNWFVSFSKRNCFTFSLIMLFLGLALSVIFKNVIFFILFFSIILFFLIYLCCGFDFNNFYKNLLLIIILDGVFFVFLSICKIDVFLHIL